MLNNMQLYSRFAHNAFCEADHLKSADHEKHSIPGEL